MYQQLLEHLVESVQGAEAALLLDAEGEVVVETGPRNERHRLIGAYQGLVLSKLTQVNDRYELGKLDYVLRRHEGGTVVVRPLKDGYYFVVSLADGTPVGPCLYQSARTRERLNEEL